MSARVLPFAVALAAMAMVPLFSSSPFYVNLTSQVAIAAIGALGLNVLVGHAGLNSLGFAVFPGLTAYLVAWLSTVGASIPWRRRCWRWAGRWRCPRCSPSSPCAPPASAS